MRVLVSVRAPSAPRSRARRGVRRDDGTSPSPTSTARARAASSTAVTMRDSKRCAVDAADATAIRDLGALHQVDVIVNVCDPRFNPSIFAAAFDGRLSLCRHGDDLVATACRTPVTRTRRAARRRSVRGVGRAGPIAASSPSWAWAWSRVSPTSSPATPPTTSSSQIDEVGVRDGNDLVVEGSTSPRRSRSGRRSKSAQSSARVGARAGLVHDARRSRNPRRSCSPRASARSSA